MGVSPVMIDHPQENLEHNYKSWQSTTYIVSLVFG